MRARAPPAGEGRDPLLRAVVVADARRPAHRGARRSQALQSTSRVLARLDRGRQVPRPPLARAPRAQRADAQGADVRADRRARRGPDDVAARDAGRHAQLGLPLHLDARRDVHAQRPALPRPELGGRRLHPVRRRPRAQRGRGAADHVRDRRRAGARGANARPPHRLRGRPAGAHRQRRLPPAPERRVRRGPRLALAARQGVRPQLRAPVAGHPRPGRAGDRQLAAARPGDLGVAQRAAALRLEQAHVLGGAGPRRPPGGAPRQGGPGGPLAPRRQRDPRRDLRARRRRARRLHAGLRLEQPRRLEPPDPARAVPAPRRRARARRRSSRSPTS